MLIDKDKNLKVAQSNGIKCLNMYVHTIIKLKETNFFLCNYENINEKKTRFQIKLSNSCFKS